MVREGCKRKPVVNDLNTPIIANIREFLKYNFEKHSKNDVPNYDTQLF